VCGIAGIVGDVNDRVEYLDGMLATLSHRGPDGQGLYCDNHFAGGMKRLSINGINDGMQPLYNQDQSIVLFYNGEIYNSKFLRNELEHIGVRFRTHSDGEVIVHLYEKIGVQAFERLDGMFAIAIWDCRCNKLILARDIPGEKPLYYAQMSSGNLAFASEVKALRKLPELDLTLNRQALWDFPTFLWIPETETAYNEIQALPKSHYLVLENGKIDIASYKFAHPVPNIDFNNEEEVVEIVRETVEEAVKSRLLSDVRVGSFLSGGLDSSIVSTIAAQELSELDTFTVAFENLYDPYHGLADESKSAIETSKIIGSNHHTIRVTADSFRDQLDDFCHYGDLPFAVSSGLGIMAVASAANDMGVKVLLTGDGADELFGGYSWYEHMGKIHSSCTDDLNYEEPVSFQNIGLAKESRLSLMNTMSSRQQAWSWHYYADEVEKNRLFSSDWSEDLNTSLRHFDSLNNKNGVERFIRQDREFYFPNEMLRKVDRMGMSHSVEGRTPFAAPQLQALADEIKYKYMVRDGSLKWVLKKAFSDRLSMDVINRPKHGFNVPIDHWLKNEWNDLVKETFSSESSLSKCNMLAPNAYATAQKMINDSSRLNGHTIFCFIMLNKWLNNLQ